MVDVAKVSMFGIPVGIFNWDDRYGVARFEYDHESIPLPIWEGTLFRGCLVCWRILCPTLMDVRCSTDGCL